MARDLFADLVGIEGPISAVSVSYYQSVGGGGGDDIDQVYHLNDAGRTARDLDPFCPLHVALGTGSTLTLFGGTSLATAQAKGSPLLDAAGAAVVITETGTYYVDLRGVTWLDFECHIAQGFALGYRLMAD